MPMETPASRHVFDSARLSVLALFCATCGGCLSSAYRIGIHDENVKFLRTQQARIELAGVVRDESGIPQRGVTIRFARKYVPAKFDYMTLPQDEREQKGTSKADPDFRLAWNVAESVVLTFEKSGYSPVTMTFAIGKTLPPNFGYQGMSAPPAEALVRNDIVVVLKRGQKEPGA
jgi:hypothetical protein